MGIFDQFLGGRESLWFEKGAAGAKQGTFRGHASTGGRRIEVLGTAVSRQGLSFVSPVRLAERELPFDFLLRARTIKSRVRVERGEMMQSAKRTVHRYFCTFTAIAADDWDAVVRYVEDIPEPVDATPAPSAPDDVFRALPQAVQNMIVAQLIGLKRLAEPRAGQAPLIRVRMLPAKTLPDGTVLREVAIHSRIAVGHETQSYDTRFRVRPNGAVEIVL